LTQNKKIFGTALATFSSETFSEEICMFARRLIFATAGLLMAIPAARADYIVNGGFETGDFTGWTVAAGSTFVTTSPFDGYSPHSGTYFAALGNQFNNGSLSQTIADTPGQNLTLNYFLAADGGTPSYFEADWNGSTILGSVLTNSAASGYIEHTFSLVSTGSDVLSFLERNDPAYWAFDDISLNVAERQNVPEPMTWSLFAAGLAAMALALRWRRKKA